MDAQERYRMREAVGLIVSADRDLFDRATAEDFGAWDLELEGPGVAYFLADLDALEVGRDGIR